MPGLPPAPVTWAMRPESVFLTICVPDCKDVTVNISETTVYFKGTDADNKTYENNMELYEEVDVEKSKKAIRDRNIEVLLIRKEKGAYWPRLLKTKDKQHWLKVDFSKWKDEDDDEEDGEGVDKYSDLFSQMNMSGMGGMGGDAPPSLDDLGDDDETDSDDDQLPDLE